MTSCLNSCENSSILHVKVHFRVLFLVLPKNSQLLSRDVDIIEDWSAADSVAVDCPLTIRRTVKHLTDHFKSKDLVGLHLARAVFRWITCHIQWKQGGSQEPDSVLRKGGGEDAGFCSLFTAMCSECGLTTKTVRSDTYFLV